jgi:hypothetical protein
MSIVIVLAALALAQHPAMPPGMTHEEHLAQMKKDAELKARGAAAMGFDQDAATHHFLITKRGGAIEVVAKSRSDAATRDAIRVHLQTIAREFADGVFAKPVATHGEEPDAVADLQRLTGSIRYRYVDRRSGGRVEVMASGQEAVNAVHAFLRYQIREHRTGGSEVR